MSNKLSLTSLEQVSDRTKFLRDNQLIPAGIKTDSQAIALISMGESLGMSDMVALQSLEFIQGQLTVKAKMVSGLLANAGIAVQTIQDCEPVTKTVLKPIPKYRVNDDGTTEPVKDANGKLCYAVDENGVVMTREEEVLTDDFVTTIKFTRYFDKIGPVSQEISFYWSDAVNAGWNIKANWIKMKRYMMHARCLTRGARIVGADIIGGLYDNYEIADAKDIDIIVD